MFAQEDGNRVLRVPEKFALGNPAHKAPEVLSALDAFRADPSPESIIVDYSGQAVFEVGVLLWEMAVGAHPVARYPTALTYTAEDVCEVSSGVQAQLEEGGYPPEFVRLVRRMVAFDAGARPSLADALRQLNVLFDPDFAALQVCVCVCVCLPVFVSRVNNVCVSVCECYGDCPCLFTPMSACLPRRRSGMLLLLW